MAVELERGKTYHTHSHILSVLDLALEGRPDVFVIRYKWKKDAPNYKEYVCAFDMPPEFGSFLTEIVLGEYKEPRSQSLNLYLYEWPDKSWRLSTIRLTDAKMLATKKVTITEGEGMQYA